MGYIKELDLRLREAFASLPEEVQDKLINLVKKEVYKSYLNGTKARLGKNKGYS